MQVKQNEVHKPSYGKSDRPGVRSKDREQVCETSIGNWEAYS